MATRESELTRDEARRIVLCAEALTAAFGRRNPTSEHATMGEEEALFNLRWELHQLLPFSGPKVDE